VVDRVEHGVGHLRLPALGDDQREVLVQVLVAVLKFYACNKKRRKSWIKLSSKALSGCTAFGKGIITRRRKKIVRT
jgi:hypothetical protein